MALALSLSGLVTTVGAYAGLAAILGLGVLALLYFAQARELQRLRDWAGRAPERAQELEERVAQQAEQAAAAARAPAPGPARPPPAPPPAARPTAAVRASRLAPTSAPSPGAAVASAAPAPAAPAGMGAPALAAATRFRGRVPAPPAAAPAAPSPAPPAPAPAGAPVPDPVPAPATAAAAAAGAPPAQGATVITGPGANGRGRDEQTAAPPVRRRPIPIRTDSASPGGAVAAPPLPPRRAGRAAGGGRGRRTTALLVAGALVLVAAAVFAVIQLTGNEGGKAAQPAAGTSAGAGSAPARPRRRARPGGSFSRGSTSVAVLNGTPTNGLAKQVADQLVRDGFGRGTVTNASDQQRSATIISYLPGFRRDAEAVAKALKVATVQPADTSTRALACPPPAACASKVVVTVGSDRGAP